ncbi:MAG: GtrA family protein [Bacteroidota bacterium]
MKELLDKAIKLFKLKAKFAMTSVVATGVDYTVYLLLVNRIFGPVTSNIISYSCGMVINFLLQKRFVFSLQRSVGKAFLGAIMVSMGGLALSTGIIYLLSQIEFFSAYQAITKLIATGIVFFYNFYFKRFVFEKRFFSVD